jgi:hypothetical protein
VAQPCARSRVFNQEKKQETRNHEETFDVVGHRLACQLAGGAGGAAHAQSSVTMFGVMDLGVQYTHGAGVGSVKALSNGGLSTSRLGFRGTEDLGGGLRAGFWLEGSLNPDTGGGRASNTNNQTAARARPARSPSTACPS